MHKNTRKLRIRLLGHFWDERTAEVHDTEDESGQRTSLNSVRNEAPFDFTASQNQRKPEQWHDLQLKPHLDEVFDDLKSFEILQSATLEAISADQPENDTSPD